MVEFWFSIYINRSREADEEASTASLQECVLEEWRDECKGDSCRGRWNGFARHVGSELPLWQGSGRTGQGRVTFCGEAKRHLVDCDGKLVV